MLRLLPVRVVTAKQFNGLRRAVEARYRRTQALHAFEAAGEGLGCPHCSSELALPEQSSRASFVNPSLSFVDTKPVSRTIERRQCL